MTTSMTRFLGSGHSSRLKLGSAILWVVLMVVLELLAMFNDGFWVLRVFMGGF